MNANQSKIYNTDLDNFEYIPEDYEEDTENTSLTIESESTITGSVMTDNLDFDIELNPFLFNYTSFNKAWKLAEVEEKKDIDILREDNTNTDNNDTSSSTFDFEFGLNESDENEYLIETKLNQQLSACPILDSIDGNIKYCGYYSQIQRPLAQLIGAWEINSGIFEQTQATNKLLTIGVCQSHFLFD